MYNVAIRNTSKAEVTCVLLLLIKETNLKVRVAMGVTCKCEEGTIEAGALGVGNVMNSSTDDFVLIA